MLAAHRISQLPADQGAEVAFAGRSNAGKSSALNALTNHKGLARTSKTPGRTQQMVAFSLPPYRDVPVSRVQDAQERPPTSVEGQSAADLRLIDLPGYGYAKAGKEARREWAARVEGYFRESRPAVVVLLVDGNVGATPLDEAAYEYLSGLGVEVIVAATKVDRISRGRWALVVRDVRKVLGLEEEIPVIPVSARSGGGIKELWGAIAPFLEASAR